MFQAQQHIHFHPFQSRESLFKTLSDDIVKRLETTLSKNRRASMVLSGGSTPAPLYQQLSQAQLDWKNITFTLSDERWVPPESESSNLKMMTQHLSSPSTPLNPQPLNLQPLTPPQSQWSQETPQIAEHLPSISQQLHAIPKPYTITLLGMGEDAHTASLFPCAPELRHALTSEEALASTTPQGADHKRITMTLQELNKSQGIILLITGEKKMNTLKSALTSKSVLTHPIKALLNPAEAASELGIKLTHTPLDIYWCL